MKALVCAFPLFIIGNADIIATMGAVIKSWGRGRRGTGRVNGVVGTSSFGGGFLPVIAVSILLDCISKSS